MKELPETADVAVLFVTAGGTDEAEVEGFDAGAVDYITKPLRPPVVRARVGTQLKLRQQANALNDLVHLDGLTGIYNRRFIDQQLAIEVARQRRRREPLTVALLDVDHFKLFNDTLGHQAGDDCLKAVARALNNATRRPRETLGRYGGEEFLAILPDIGLVQSDRYGDWIRRQICGLAIAHPASSCSRQVTVSVGLAVGIPWDETTPDVFLLAADKALYRAKEEARNTHRINTL